MPNPAKENVPPKIIKPSSGDGFEDDPKPVQVVRKTDIDQSTVDTNAIYHRDPLVQGTVWRFYNLIRTQWPGRARSPLGTGQPIPATHVANVTMETYLQANDCIRCHFATGKLTDRPTDFVWFLSMRALPPMPTPVAAKAANQVKSSGAAP
jgi:hypothetical protein